MSRIFGYLSRADADHDSGALERMMNRVRHRSVEKEKSISLGNASFGWSGTGTGWEPVEINNILIAMDGYIYNAGDLGDGTDKADTRVFYDLYRKHGFEDSVKRINGDFSIALYDGKEDLLWLARDRLGVKPFYYCEKDNFFAFSSRLSPFLALPGVTGSINREFVAIFAGSHYRYFDNDLERTPFEEVCQLPAGNILRFNGIHRETRKFWQLHEMPEHAGSEKDLAEQYRVLLFDAVKIRYAKAQKPAFTLSGGMDSSSILAASTRVSNQKQIAFSTVYEDKTYDESDDIQTILGPYVERWRPIEIGNPDLQDVVPKMIAVHDEPVATATWLSHFLLCEQVAREEFGSLFGGLGGDELNAGEYEYFFYYFADLKTEGKEDQLGREISKWVEYHDHPIFKKNVSVVEDYLSRCVDMSIPGKCMPEQNRLKKYYGTVNKEYFDLEMFEPSMETPFHSYLKNRTFQDITRETIPCCLRAEDRQAEVAGLEHFDPFLDHRLVEFMFRISGALKIRNGVTKILLREAMKSVLPETTRNRIKKTGWNAPAHIWFANGGHELLMDLVHTKHFQERGIYDIQKVINIVEEHQKIISNNELKENHMMFLWQLQNLEYWFQFIEDHKG